MAQIREQTRVNFKIMETIETSPIVKGKEKISIAASFGVTQWETSIKDIGKMLEIVGMNLL